MQHEDVPKLTLKDENCVGRFRILHFLKCSESWRIKCAICSSRLCCMAMWYLLPDLMWTFQVTCSPMLVHLLGFKIFEPKQSPIYFVKIWPPDFFAMNFSLRCIDFYKISPSKSVPFQRWCHWIFVVNTIFFTSRSFFTSDGKVDTWFHTHLHCFATVI